MDIDKAKSAYRLYARRDNLRSSILTMESRMKAFPNGTTNLTIPTAWIPTIIKIAEDELGQVEDEIAKL